MFEVKTLPIRIIREKIETKAFKVREKERERERRERERERERTFFIKSIFFHNIFV